MRPLGFAALITVAWTCTHLRADDDDPVYQRKPLSAWLEILRGGRDQPGRLAAPHVLGSPGGLAAVWAGPLNNRRAALLVVELVGPLRSAKVIPAAAAALRNDPAERFREAAAQALGRMCTRARAESQKIDAGRDALINALRNDRSGRVREAAATALGRLETDALPGLSALAAALADPHAGTRTAAAEALRRLGKDARDALPELQTVLRDRTSTPMVRIQAALALGRIGGPEAVPTLIQVLDDKAGPSDLRRAAAEALAMMGNEAVPGTAALAGALVEPGASTELRRAAAAALDQLGAAALSALPSLKKAMKDDDRFVRCLAMHCVGQMGADLGRDAPAIVTALLQGLGDGIAEVRVAAIEALGALGPAGVSADLPAVRQRLLDATRDSQKAVREAAADALKKLANP